MNMQIIKVQVKAFLKDEEGLTTVEYAIAGALVGIAVIGSFTQLGSDVGTAVTAMSTAICGGAGVSCTAVTP